MTSTEQSVVIGAVIVVGLILASWRDKAVLCSLVGHSFPIKDPRICRRCKIPYTEWWN